MPDPRKMLHILVCDTDRKCRYDSGSARGDATPQCRKLDELLDCNDELVLHGLARDVHHFGTAWTGEGVNEKQAVAVIADRIDPFQRVEASDPKPHIDCPGCARGIEHYHRRSDGSPVTTPTLIG
jgi:hypothetical protein